MRKSKWIKLKGVLFKNGTCYNEEVIINLTLQELAEQLKAQGYKLEQIYWDEYKEWLKRLKKGLRPDVGMRERVANVLETELPWLREDLLELADEIIKVIPPQQMSEEEIEKIIKKSELYTTEWANLETAPKKLAHSLFGHIPQKDKFPKMFPISACCNSSVKEHTIYTCEACEQGCKLSADFKPPQKKQECEHEWDFCGTGGTSTRIKPQEPKEEININNTRRDYADTDEIWEVLEEIVNKLNCLQKERR